MFKQIQISITTFPSRTKLYLFSREFALALCNFTKRRVTISLDRGKWRGFNDPAIYIYIYIKAWGRGFGRRKRNRVVLHRRKRNDNLCVQAGCVPFEFATRSLVSRAGRVVWKHGCGSGTARLTSGIPSDYGQRWHTSASLSLVPPYQRVGTKPQLFESEAIYRVEPMLYADAYKTKKRRKILKILDEKSWQNSWFF